MAMPPSPKPSALDFFAGSGLAAEALRPHFSVVWANDVCPKKAATYCANHPRKAFLLGGIADVRGADLPKAALAWASFPCQDLSLAGNLGGIGSARSGLVWQWLRVMDEMPCPPPLVVAENVAGLLSASGGAHYAALHRALRGRGYRVGALLLDAAAWLPQSRPRVFVVGAAEWIDARRFESPSPLWCHPMPVQRAAGLGDGFVWWRLPEPRGRRKALGDVVDFSAPTHPPDVSERNLRLVPPAHRVRLEAAANGRDAAFPGYKRTRGGRQVLELRFDGLAGCLRTPQGGSSRQYLVLRRNGRFETRLLTVREAARLMGVREGYRILGTYNDGYKAMGDAVAVPVVRHLAKHLLAPLAKAAMGTSQKVVSHVHSGHQQG